MQRFLSEETGFPSAPPFHLGEEAPAEGVPDLASAAQLAQVVAECGLRASGCWPERATKGAWSAIEYLWLDCVGVIDRCQRRDGGSQLSAGLIGSWGY